LLCPNKKEVFSQPAAASEQYEGASVSLLEYFANQLSVAEDFSHLHIRRRCVKARLTMVESYDDGGDAYCKIYDRDDFFTTLVQMLLALCCLGALWYKRLTEVPRRTFWTWFMDVTKQGAGACYAHVLNMVRPATGDYSQIIMVPNLLDFVTPLGDCGSPVE
jgi:hypothetical protein